MIIIESKLCFTYFSEILLVTSLRNKNTENCIYYINTPQKDQSAIKKLQLPINQTTE